LEAVIYTVHVLLAGVWLGGVVFTTVVVSPALKAMPWSEAERVVVRSVIGKQYAKVATANLVALALFAALDGAVRGFGSFLYAEYALIAVLFGLAASHGAYFGRRMRQLAEAEKSAERPEDANTFAGKRRSLRKVSFRISMLDIVVSVAIVALAVNG
jgi:uncharacterized membrane protein